MDAKERFSDRVADYVRSRPAYPAELYDFLREELKLSSTTVIADVGSGTGIFSLPLLERGYGVFAVEPNAAMRAAAEASLAGFAKFRSVDASAEATSLPDRSVDLVTSAQAFHWFDREKARREFVRILRPGGFVALVWNERRLDATPFLRDYESLLLGLHGDYQQKRHEHIDARVIADFFAPDDYKTREFFNAQRFDYAGLESRLLSSSYTPPAGDPRRGPMLAKLREIFEKNQQNGHVDFEYDTRVHYGTLT